MSWLRDGGPAGFGWVGVERLGGWVGGGESSGSQALARVGGQTGRVDGCGEDGGVWGGVGR